MINGNTLKNKSDSICRGNALASKMDATLEHLHIGAIKGQILDADGSAVIYDLFTEFGVSQHSELDFDLDNASPVADAVKKKCHDVRRKVEDKLGAQPYDHIHAICGADFVETAETIGLPRYAKQAVDQQFARWVMVHVQSNLLPICTRPRVLLKSKRT